MSLVQAKSVGNDRFVVMYAILVICL